MFEKERVIPCSTDRSSFHSSIASKFNNDQRFVPKNDHFQEYFGHFWQFFPPTFAKNVKLT